MKIRGTDLTKSERQAVIDFIGELGNYFTFTDSQIFEFAEGRCVGSVEDLDMVKLIEIENYVGDDVVFSRLGAGSLG